MVDILSRIPKRDQVMRTVKKVPGAAGNVATVGFLRKGKDLTADRTFGMGATGQREREARQLQRQTPEKKGANEMESNAFVAVEKVSINLVNNEITSVAKKQGEAETLKKAGDTTLADNLATDEPHQALLQVDKLLKASSMTDEQFSKENPAGYDYSDPANPPIKVTAASGEVQVMKIVGKKGGKFLCEIKDASGQLVATPVEISSGDVIRGELVADAANIRKRFDGDPDGRQKIFDTYIESLQGNTDNLPKDEAQQQAHKERVTRVAQEQGIPTYDDLFVAIDNLTGYHSNTEPGEHATQDEWKRWNKKQQLRAPLEKRQGEVVVDAKVVTDIMMEDLAGGIQEQTAQVAQLQQAAKDGIISQGEVDAAQLQLGALRLADSHKGDVGAYFNGVISGAIPPEVGREIVTSIRDADCTSAVKLIPQISSFVTTNDQEKRQWEERAKKVDGRRKFALTGLAALVMLGYLAQSQLTNE